MIILRKSKIKNNPCFISPCFINPCFINPCFITHVLLIHVFSLHLLLIHVLLIHVLLLHVLLIHVLLIHVLSLHLLLIQSMFYQSSPVHILSHAQSDNMTTDLYHSGPLRDPFFPLTTPTMLWIEAHQPWARFVIHQSLTTTVVQIVWLSKSTLSPDGDLQCAVETSRSISLWQSWDKR